MALLPTAGLVPVDGLLPGGFPLRLEEAGEGGGEPTTSGPMGWVSAPPLPGLYVLWEA